MALPATECFPGHGTMPSTGAILPDRSSRPDRMRRYAGVAVFLLPVKGG